MATIEIIKSEYIAHIVLARPEKLNAINLQVWLDLREAAGELSSDGSIRCAIMRGKGRAFSSGLDLSPENEMFRTLAEGSDKSALLQRFRRLISEFEPIFASIESLPFPVIAACHGYALGVGLELALCADFIMASEETVFSIPEVELGLIPDMGGNQRLVRFAGLPRARELIYTGERITAAEAHAIGLANRILPNPEALFKEAEATAQRIARNAPLAVRAAKRAINHCYAPKRDQMEFNSELAAACAISNDVLEAIRAKLDGSKPQFKGE